jgi:hypothetical protein
MRHSGILFAGLITLLAGCDQFVASPAPAPATPAVPAQPTLPSSGGILAPGGFDEMAKPVNSGPALNPPANAPPVTQEAAGVGSGIKGRSLEEPGTVRLIAEPAIAYFRTKERLVFEVQIPQAMNLYKATEGKAPATHDEFMQMIIQANQINLPALPQGQRYVYDPTTEQLMVEKPVRQ